MTATATSSGTRTADQQARRHPAKRSAGQPPGKPSRLHPASLAAEAASLAEPYLQPGWRRAENAAGRVRCGRCWTVVSPLGWVVAGSALLLLVLGAAFGWQEAKIAALIGACPAAAGHRLRPRPVLLRRGTGPGPHPRRGRRPRRGQHRRDQHRRPAAAAGRDGAARGRGHRRVPVAPDEAGQVHEDLFTIPTAPPRRHRGRPGPLGAPRPAGPAAPPDDVDRAGGPVRAPADRGPGGFLGRLHPRPGGPAHQGPVQRRRLLPRPARLRPRATTAATSTGRRRPAPTS